MVYIEVAFAENFLMDGMLLYLALKCAREKVRPLNLILAALVGAAEAILFPLIPLPVWCAYLVKFLGGALISVISVHKGRPKSYLVAAAAFFLLTFALGGLLVAAYSFFGAEYREGDGYLVESAPIALVVTAAIVFFLLILSALRRFFRFRVRKSNLIACTLCAGGRRVHMTALADSGNCLQFRGKPVCLTSAAGIFALLGAHPSAVGRMKVGTVHGERESPVFLCREMELGGKTFGEVPFVLGEMRGDIQMILHTAYLEGSYENTDCVENLAG